jgi:DNA-binding transcriptional ArsR family regulator
LIIDRYIVLSALRPVELSENAEDVLLDRVFFALSDPVRRAIMLRLDEGARLVSELAAPFYISLQAVSRHIQVLARAGLVGQERSGRISRCSLDAGPTLTAALWLNRYCKHWQAQFDPLTPSLAEIAERRPRKRRRTRTTNPPTKGSPAETVGGSRCIESHEWRRCAATT